jgi:L-arabinose transport system substrate-binding protein
MPRSLRALVVGTVLALESVVLAGCGAVASPAPSTPSAGSPGPSAGTRPLFVAIAAAADADPAGGAAAFATTIEELGGRALTRDARRDPRITVGLVQEALAAGARGISLTAPDGSVGPPIARLVAGAGVPLVATQARLADGAGVPLPFVGVDDRDLGATVGATAADLVARSGWRPAEVGVLSAEVQTLASCAARAEGELQALRAAGIPPANVVPVPYSGEVRSAADAALPLITAGPQVSRWVVVGCDDQGVQGAMQALATAGFVPPDVIGVGLGADLACRAWAHGDETGFRAAVFVYGGEVGAAAARVLWDAAQRGDPLPAETIVHGAVVTPASWEDLVPASFAEACAGSAEP